MVVAGELRAIIPNYIPQAWLIAYMLQFAGRTGVSSVHLPPCDAFRLKATAKGYHRCPCALPGQEDPIPLGPPS